MRYAVPVTVDEAVSLGSRSGARYLAGGTDLAVQIAEGAVRAALLVDVTRIAALQGIRGQGAALRLGAAVTLEQVARAPGLPACLAQGARAVGSPQIRHLGTLGGNLCNASPCGDTLAPLLVLGARLQLRSRTGRREIEAERFFLGPKATALQPGELLEAVLIPGEAIDPARVASAFRMLGKRNAQAISQVNLAVWLRPEKGSGRLEEVRLAAGSVAPVPLRLRRTEALLQGRVPEEALLAEAAALAAEEVRPISDVRAGEAYRRRITSALLRDALAEALAERSAS